MGIIVWDDEYYHWCKNCAGYRAIETVYPNNKTGKVRYDSIFRKTRIEEQLRNGMVPVPCERIPETEVPLRPERCPDCARLEIEGRCNDERT